MSFDYVLSDCYIPCISKSLHFSLMNGCLVVKEMRDDAVALSICREEAAAGVHTSDSIKSLIIDDDPIEELWLRDEQKRTISGKKTEAPGRTACTAPSLTP